MVVGAMEAAVISAGAGTVSVAGMDTVVTAVTATDMVGTGTATAATVMDMAATATEPRTTELVLDTALAIAASATEVLATTATTRVRIPAITRRTQPTGRPTSLRVGFCIDDRTRAVVDKAFAMRAAVSMARFSEAFLWSGDSRLSLIALKTNAKTCLEPKRSFLLLLSEKP